MTKMIYCPHCNHGFESDDDHVLCPKCGRTWSNLSRKATGYEIGMGNFFQKTTKENLSALCNKIMGIFFSLIMLFLVLTNDEVDGFLKVMILILLSVSVLIGRKLVFIFPSVPSVWVYFFVEVVLIYAFILLFLALCSDPWPIQFLFGYTHIGRFIFTCFLCLGPAMFISKL